MRKKTVGLVATATTLALVLSACSSTPDDDTSDVTPEFNAAVGQVYNPSDYKGGTLKFAISEDWDSVDPGDTYYGLSWNLVRLYSRALVMYKPVPGAAGLELTPDLAESMGEVSDDGLTWTYKLRAGLKFEDGSPITSADVKYAVMRAIDTTGTLQNGVGLQGGYLQALLDLGGDTYGPYAAPGVDNPAITTPDDLTIEFHLSQPFSGFDYIAMLPLTAPVPEAADDGVNYKEHVVSSGPYKFESYDAGVGFTLVRNDQWDPASDPNRKALPDRYEITLGVAADDIDNQIASGDLDVDLAGTGVQSAMLSQVLDETNPLHARADNPGSARQWYTSILERTAPLDNVHCRRAIEYAADRTGYQAAYGGALAGGDISTQALVPPIPGYQKFDLYPAGADNTGDLDKAREELTECGQADGFDIAIAFRSDRPKEQAVAESLQQSLGRVGINLTLVGHPTSGYFTSFTDEYIAQNNIGLATNGWAADWNDGYGFLGAIVDSRLIGPGSSNLGVNDPAIDALIDEALGEPDLAARTAIWAEVDKKVMEGAFILPGVWSKSVTLRSQNAANIFVQESFGQYDYLSMSVAPPA
jgi:peptide/nickel transport system substrate-binding protein